MESTKLDDSNPFWVVFKQTCDDNDIQLDPIICPGGTDARNLRGVSFSIPEISKQFLLVSTWWKLIFS